MNTSHSSSWRTLVAAVCLVTVLGGASWVLTDQGVNTPTAEYPIQAALPKSFLAHISIDGVAGSNSCRELAMAQLMEEPQMKQFMAPGLEMIDGLLAEEVAPMLEELGLTRTSLYRRIRKFGL